MSVQGFPNGLWVYNNGTFQQTNFDQSQILSLHGVPVASHEAREAIALLNVADFKDPSAYADIELGNRNLAATMSSNLAYQEYMQTSGLIAPLGATYVTPYGQTPPALPGGNYTPPTINPNPVNPNPVNPNPVNPNPVNPNPVNPVNPFNPVNPVNPNPVNPVNPNPVNPVNPTPVNPNGNLTPPDPTNYAAQFNARISLIDEYCDKWGRTVDTAKIRADYASDPEAGVEYCDDILNNQFDQTKLRNIVHKHYEAYNKAREDAGKAVSDNWVQAVLNQGLGSFNLSTAGVDKNNILDVIGTFATNQEVKDGKVSLENVMESPQFTAELIETMKAKADEALLDENVDDSIKTQLLSKIESLRTNYDRYTDSISDDNRMNDVEFNSIRKQLAKDVFDMFALMRMDEAKKNDEAAPQYYGLPEDSTITFNDQQVRARDEITSYNSRRRLSVSI